MIIYFGACVCLLGLVFGSFLNCTAMRLVRGEDFVRGRSKCPNCGHELSAIELIPVLSYLIQGGKCRHCKAKISPRYITAEIVFALLSMGLYMKLVYLGIFETANIVIFFRDWVFTGCLFLAALTDLENFEIYDGVLIFGFASFLIFEFVLVYVRAISISDLGWTVFAGILTGLVLLILSLIMDKILQKESLGGGDIKLFALLGMYLGFYGAYELVVLTCITGLIFAGVRKKILPGASKEFPLGPAIALSGYILLLTEKFITSWYFTLF